LLDRTAEAGHASGISGESTGGEFLHALQRLSDQALAELTRALDVGQANSESAEQLADRIRAIYNGLTDALPERLGQMRPPLINTGLQPGVPTTESSPAASAASTNLEHFSKLAPRSNT
jgi:hypothetical protein